MPLYEYLCSNCDLEFEDLSLFEKKDEKNCPSCGEKAIRRPASQFGVNTSIDHKKDTIVSNKEIDKVIGQDAERKRKIYEENRKKRWGNKVPELLNIPKDADGKYSPIQHLGDSTEREFRKGYSEMLKEHRKDRNSKGKGQFDGTGFGKDNDSIIVKKTNK